MDLKMRTLFGVTLLRFVVDGGAPHSGAVYLEGRYNKGNNSTFTFFVDVFFA